MKLNPITGEIENTELSQDDLNKLVASMPANTTNGLGEEDPQPTQAGRDSRSAEVMKYFDDKYQPTVGRLPAEEVLAKFNALKSSPNVNGEEATSTEPIKTRQNLLDEYKRLIQERDTKNTVLNLSKAMGGVADAFTVAGGGKVLNKGFEDELMKQNQQKVDDYFNRSKALDVENEVQLNDPNSDISKLARENATAYAKRLGLSENTISRLDGLSAKQLEKLGIKSTSIIPQLRFERIKDSNGVVKTVAIDTKTGQIVREIGESGFASQFRTDPNTGELVALNSSNPSSQPILPGKSNVGSTMSENKEVPKIITRKDLNPKQKELVDKTREYLNSNDQVKAAKEAIDGAESVRALLAGDMTILRAVQNKLARATGEKGTTTESDVAPFGGRQGVLQRLERLVQYEGTGTLPDGDKKFLRELAATLEASAKRNLDEESFIASKRLSDDTGFTLEQASKLLNTESILNPKQLSKELNSDTVKVRQLRSGKIGSMPRDKAEDAIKSGLYEEVK